MAITDRKAEHLSLAGDPASQSAESTAFDDVRLVPEALPELDLADVDLRTRWLGRELAGPLFVTGMTGGTAAAADVNRGVAAGCQAVGLGMGLGSQRAMLADPECTETFQVRDVAPDICLAGNIGAAQLLEYDTDAVLAAVEAVGADMLAVHLNAAQEAVQPEGTPAFRGVADAIRRLCAASAIPVYIKEVGCGMSQATAARLADLGVAALDVAGAGGTSWPKIELQRSAGTSALAEHGIPTVWSLLEARRGFSGPLMASGGIRSSRHVAAMLALGATACGMAWPVLRAFQDGATGGVTAFLRGMLEDVRRQCFIHGAATCEAMRTVPVVLLGDTLAWARQRGVQAC